ncbi:MAG: hypothetical protein FWF24_00945 [Alphaproteobacteria bacterium]|nr:hypothetical protein [Alphaproteobacteria bacterium]
MTKQERLDQNSTECKGIPIFEEFCGETIRVCDPAEFGITAKKRTPSPKKPYVLTHKEKGHSVKQPQGPIVITQETLGQAVRAVDIAELNAIVKKQLNLG